MNKAALVRPEFVNIIDGLPDDIRFGWWRSHDGWTVRVNNRILPGDVITRTYDNWDKRPEVCGPGLHAGVGVVDAIRYGYGGSLDLVGLFGEVSRTHAGKMVARYRVHFARTAVPVYPRSANDADFLRRFTNETGIGFTRTGKVIKSTLPFDLYWKR